MKKKLIFLTVLISIIFLNLPAQIDTITNDLNVKLNHGNIDTVTIKLKTKNASKAALYSAIIPGWGQAYNEKYWKVPLLYSLIGGALFFSDYNNKQYNRYLTAYVAETDDLIETVSEFEGKRTEEDLLYMKNKFRRNRDISYLSLLAIYFLNIVDATTDAHLYDFDVGDDLSFKVFPDIVPVYTYRSTIGLTLIIKF